MTDSEETNYRHDFWQRVDKSSHRDVQHLLALYDGEIRYTEHVLGQVLHRLRMLDTHAELILIIVSDHGEEFDEHGDFLQTNVYRECTHVPLIVNLPTTHSLSSRAGLKRNLVGLIDVMPSLLRLLDIDGDFPFQGGPLLLTQLPDPTEIPHIFTSKFNIKESVSAVQTATYKYIFNRMTSVKELYNIQTDPQERHNLSRYYDFRHDISAMKDLLKTQQDENDVVRGSFGETQPLPLDDDSRKKLEALGYINVDLTP